MVRETSAEQGFGVLIPAQRRTGESDAGESDAGEPRMDEDRVERRRASQHGAGERGASQHGRGEHTASQHGPGEHTASQHGPGEHGVTGNGASDRSADQDRPTQDAGNPDRAGEREASQHGTSDRSAAQDRGAQDAGSPDCVGPHGARRRRGGGWRVVRWVRGRWFGFWHGGGWRYLRGNADPFLEIEFVIVDVETTGWSPEDAAITEIAAVRVKGGRVTAQFSSLVNPGSEIPERVAALTGISDAMVAAAPPLSSVMPSFLAFAEGGVLTAHNAPFDIGFLTAACRDLGLAWPEFAVLDTVELARRLVSRYEVPDRRLATLARFFRATTLPTHRALPDVLATADVLRGLLRRLAAAGGRTLPQCSVSDGHAHAGTGGPATAA